MKVKSMFSNIGRKINHYISKRHDSNNYIDGKDKRESIKYRLIRAFSVLILLNILISTASIYMIKSMSNTLDQMTDVYMKQVDLARQMEIANKNMMMSLHSYVYDATSTENLENIYTNLSNLKDLKNKALEIDTDGVSNKFLLETLDAYQELDGVVDVIIQDIRNGKSRTALDIFNVGYSSVFNKITTSISNYVTAKQEVINQKITSVKERESISIALLVIANIFIIFIGITMMFAVTNRITKPIRLLIDKSKKVSDGDLTVSVDVYTHDEVGILAKAFSDMINTLNHILSNLNRSAIKLLDLSKSIEINTASSAEAGEQISKAMNNTTEGAEKQVNVIEDSKIFVEKIVKDMNIISVSTLESTQTSSKSGELAKLGSEKIAEVTHQIYEINDIVSESAEIARELEYKSSNVSEITKIITEFTTQTKLLALNATIEAAKAGPEGKSFSIVANDIRKLAQKSKEAAMQIDNVIKDMREQVGKSTYMAGKCEEKVKIGMDSISSANAVFKQIFNFSNLVIAKINESHNSVKNTVKDSQEILSSFNEIDEVAKISSESMKEIAAATERQAVSISQINESTRVLLNLSEGLYDILSKFKII